MMAWSQSSDRSGERHLHTAFAALLATGGLAASAFAQSPPWRCSHCPSPRSARLPPCDLLEPGDQLSFRRQRRRRSRTDKLDWQSRGVRWSLSRRLDQDRDRRLFMALLTLAVGPLATAVLFCVCAISSNEIISLRFTNAISLESQMIVSSASDYREAARRKLPRFLFDYIDGEPTLNNAKSQYCRSDRREPETAGVEGRFRPEPRD